MAKKTKIKQIIILLSFVFLVRCASQLPPKGGEVDRIPPEIVEVIPSDGTINYNENYFELTFSEYVNKRSVQEAIFISPNIEGNIEYDWSGKTLRGEMPDTLLENTTYTVTVGTDVEDVNNSNKMYQAYTFAFSTGDKIDKGTVTGTIYDKNPSSIMIYAYVKDDTLNPVKQKPKYVSQTGASGYFRVTGLADDEYRVFAVRDEYRDFLYNPTQDAFGVPFKDITLSGKDTLFTGLNYFMQLADTSQPSIYNLTMTDKHHILIEFSEAIDSSVIDSDNFFLYDSTTDRKINIDYFYKGKTRDKNFLISFKDTVNDSESLQLISRDITDRKGNVNPYEATTVVVNDKPDTLQPRNAGFVTQYPDKRIDYKKGWIKISYDDAFDTSTLNDAVNCVDERNREVNCNIDLIDDASFRLEFSNLAPDKEYKINIDQNYFADAAGNKIDSVFTYNFKTVNNLDFSGASGVITNNSEPDKTVVILENIDQKNIIRKTKPDNGRFNFERVYPGKYLLWSFIDQNKNGEYDKGNIYPFEASEEFIYYRDTLNLRPRWPVGDISLDYIH